MSSQPTSNSQAEAGIADHAFYKPLVAPGSENPSLHPQTMATTAGMQASTNPFPNRQSPHDGGITQQQRPQNVSRTQPPTQIQPSSQPPQSPQTVAREKARVSVLLEINSHLLQEVVTLQAQGKAGGPAAALPQQSPTQDVGANSPTPTSATDPSNPLNNSPIGAAKPAGSKPSSHEYVECMRRLQANLAYLAAIADAKKKAAGTVPTTPAIMAPPTHLSEVHDLYKRLSVLFPIPAQSVSNKSVSSTTAQV